MSELRKDIVSGDWILMAPGRSKRPHENAGPIKKRKPSPKKDCPFEQPQNTGNWPPIHRWPASGSWRVILIPNKYPALHHEDICPSLEIENIYPKLEGVGWHDLIVTRDHEKDFPNLSSALSVRVLKMIQQRYLDARKDKCMQYVSAFGNWGQSAGASLFHPHYQLLSLPIIPPKVSHALAGSHQYFKKHGRCPHCEIIAQARKDKKNILLENSTAVVLAPFASRTPYALQIFPKKHQARFGSASVKMIESIASLLRLSLRRVSSRLGDPDYNFFIHSAPLREEARFNHYHWHVEVVPKISAPAGFELSTGIDVNVVTPEEAIKALR